MGNLKCWGGPCDGDWVPDLGPRIMILRSVNYPSDRSGMVVAKIDSEEAFADSRVPGRYRRERSLRPGSFCYVSVDVL